MQQSTAIIVGSTIIGACILAHLGYDIAHDRAIADVARKEQDVRLKAAAAAAATYKRAQTKEVWKLALKSMDSIFENWVKKEIKSAKNPDPHVHIEMVLVKTFALSDVEWKDDTHVMVHGLLAASFKAGSDSDLFTWTRNAQLKGDGVDTWWQEEAVAFGYSNLRRDQWANSMPTQMLFLSGGSYRSDWRSPLVQ